MLYLFAQKLKNFMKDAFILLNQGLQSFSCQNLLHRPLEEIKKRKYEQKPEKWWAILIQTITKVIPSV